MLFRLWSKRFTVYYYPGHRIQNQFCTQSALSPLPGEPVAILQARTMPTEPQYRLHPTGSPFNTWVGSSNVDKVCCWRTKEPGDSGIRTRSLSVRVERSHHYTTAPPQLMPNLEENEITKDVRYTGWPRVNGTVDTVDFQDFALINN